MDSCGNPVQQGSGRRGTGRGLRVHKHLGGEAERSWALGSLQVKNLISVPSRSLFQPDLSMIL